MKGILEWNGFTWNPATSLLYWGTANNLLPVEAMCSFSCFLLYIKRNTPQNSRTRNNIILVFRQSNSFFPDMSMKQQAEQSSALVTFWFSGSHLNLKISLHFPFSFSFSFYIPISVPSLSPSPDPNLAHPTPSTTRKNKASLKE